MVNTKGIKCINWSFCVQNVCYLVRRLKKEPPKSDPTVYNCQPIPWALIPRPSLSRAVSQGFDSRLAPVLVNLIHSEIHLLLKAFDFFTKCLLVDTVLLMLGKGSLTEVSSIFLIKQFSSKGFGCLWKPVALQLKILMTPLHWSVGEWPIGHFRVLSCLCFITSLSAIQPFIWKWVLHAVSFLCKSKSFS